MPVPRGPANVITKVHEQLRKSRTAVREDDDESDGGDEIMPSPTRRKLEKSKPAARRSPISEGVTTANVQRDNPSLYLKIQTVIAASFKNDSIPKRTGNSFPIISTSSGSSLSKRRTRRGGIKVHKKRQESTRRLAPLRRPRRSTVSSSWTFLSLERVRR